MNGKILKIIFVTSKGNIRKNSLEDFININASGKIAMKLSDDDKIIGVKICKEDQDILLSTKFGKCIRFMSKKLRLFKGRSSKGIRGMQLADGDEIISLSILDNSKIDNKKINKDPKIKKRFRKIYSYQYQKMVMENDHLILIIELQIEEEKEL